MIYANEDLNENMAFPNYAYYFYITTNKYIIVKNPHIARLTDQEDTMNMNSGIIINDYRLRLRLSD
ncbi:hypothetical protein V1478_000849 [Vespula squamosa]|uniref:Uncharacterized protein n=1 Tax=Vespula squamosa TaxID=30214 RepID=A0ABD2C6P1_VESSQ